MLQIDIINEQIYLISKPELSFLSHICYSTVTSQSGQIRRINLTTKHPKIWVIKRQERTTSFTRNSHSSSVSQQGCFCYSFSEFQVGTALLMVKCMHLVLKYKIWVMQLIITFCSSFSLFPCRAATVQLQLCLWLGIPKDFVPLGARQPGGFKVGNPDQQNWANSGSHR